MQSRYAQNFQTLTEVEAAYFADAISKKIEAPVSGETLFNDLVELNIDHKTACMSLANDPSIVAIVCLEKVVGKPIFKHTPVVPTNTRVTRTKSDGTPRPKLLKNDPRVIYDIVAGAKRPGSKSYERYMLYKENMTVTEFLAAGGTTGDIQHDVSKGFIKLKDAE